MRALLLLSIVAIVAFATFPPPPNLDELITQQEEKPPVGFAYKVWAALGKYYRVAKSKFYCFMWGKHCSKPQIKQPPILAGNEEWSDVSSESPTWFDAEKRALAVPPEIQHASPPLLHQHPFDPTVILPKRRKVEKKQF